MDQPTLSQIDYVALAKPAGDCKLAAYIEKNKAGVPTKRFVPVFGNTMCSIQDEVDSIQPIGTAKPLSEELQKLIPKGFEITEQLGLVTLVVPLYNVTQLPDPEGQRTVEIEQAVRDFLARMGIALKF